MERGGLSHNDHGAGRHGISAALGMIAVLVLVVGLVGQAGFLVRDVSHELTRHRPNEGRTFLQAANRLMAPDATYVVVNDRPSVRYFLYPRQAVSAAPTRPSIERSGARYVIEMKGPHPPALRGHHAWFRVMLMSPRGRLLEVLR